MAILPVMDVFSQRLLNHRLLNQQECWLPETRHREIPAPRRDGPKGFFHDTDGEQKRMDTEGEGNISGICRLGNSLRPPYSPLCLS